MCNPASMVVSKTKVYWSKKSDSHTAIIEEHNLKELEVVKVEVTPPEKNRFDLPPEQWIFKTDQDILPDWYCKAEVELATRRELPNWIAEKVVTEGHRVVNAGETVFFFGNSTSTVNDGGRACFYDNATGTVNGGWAYFSGNSIGTVNGGKARFYDNATGTVNGGWAYFYDNSTGTVNGGWARFYDNATGTVDDGGRVRFSDNATGTVNGGWAYFYDNSTGTVNGGWARFYDNAKRKEQKC